MRSGKGFIAALDQSGGSTPKALSLYGIGENQYADEDQMFNLIHAMRARIMTSSVFTSQRILAVILFEQTMNRSVDGLPTAQYLWEKKGIIPFLKIDDGLAKENEGVQCMKPIPELHDRLAAAILHGIFGTKMRSVIKEFNPAGIQKLVQQQFDVAYQIMAAGLIPIIEPEVDITSATKDRCEKFLNDELLLHLDKLSAEHHVMLKLTIPTLDNLYEEVALHPRVLRVAALSGGYTRDEATQALRRNRRMIASFSRALTEGLHVDQSPDEFDKKLDESIESIFTASVIKG